MTAEPAVIRRWVIHVHELEDHRLVLGIEQPGGTDYAGWLMRLAAAVERELAGNCSERPDCARPRWTESAGTFTQ